MEKDNLRGPILVWLDFKHLFPLFWELFLENILLMNYFGTNARKEEKLEHLEVGIQILVSS